jgi:hypothetical protein
MDENAEETLAQLVAGLPPESYERYAPGLQELGLALAERRVAFRIHGVLRSSSSGHSRKFTGRIHRQDPG